MAFSYPGSLAVAPRIRETSLGTRLVRWFKITETGPYTAGGGGGAGGATATPGKTILTIFRIH